MRTRRGLSSVTLVASVAALCLPVFALALFDDAAPTNNGLKSMTVDSSSRVTVVANPGVDYGGTLDFDGNGDYVKMSGLVWTPTAFTVSWWLYPLSAKSFNQIMVAGGGWDAWLIHAGSNGSAYVGINAGLGRFTPTDLPAGTIEIDKWQHFVFTFDNRKARFYKNSVLLASKEDMPYPIQWSGFNIGTSDNRTIDGRIDEVAIYDRGISASEVSNLYNNFVNPLGETGLVSLWNFNEGSGTIANDTVGSNDGVIHEADWADGPSSGLDSSPYQFDETTGNGHDSGWMTSTSYVDTALTPNTNYSYKVKVRDALGNESAFSSELSATTFANVPTGGAFSNITEKSLMASWDANSNPAITEYYIENQTAGTTPGWQTGTSWTSDSLSEETDYSFRVKARNADKVETNWHNLGSQATTPKPEDKEEDDKDDEDDSDEDKKEEDKDESDKKEEDKVEKKEEKKDDKTKEKDDKEDVEKKEDKDEKDKEIVEKTVEKIVEKIVEVSQPVGPKVETVYVAPRVEDADVGTKGTTSPDLSIIGGTWPEVPIKATLGDVTPPRIEMIISPERINRGGKFNLKAKAIDDQGEVQGVIEYLGYSLDSGTSWHPVSSVEGIGEKEATFEINSFPLADSDYEILLRARDNSENETTLNPIPVVIDQENPYVVSLDTRVGAQKVTSKSSGWIVVPARLRFQIVAKLAGGPNKASLKVGEQVFDLKPSDVGEYWTGQVNLGKPGNFTSELKAVDGAGNKMREEVFGFVVADPLSVEVGPDRELTIYEFNEQVSDWQVFNARAWQEKNPLGVDRINREGVLLPAGRYYTKVGTGIWPLGPGARSNIFDLSETGAPSGSLKSISPSGEVVEIAEDPLPSAEALKKVKTSAGSEMAALRENDVILFNFNPESYVSLEQLLIYNRLAKDASRDLTVVAVTPDIYRNQAESMARRGAWEVRFSFDEEKIIQRELFSYQSPASLFIDQEGKPMVAASGFVTKEEVEDILKQI